MVSFALASVAAAAVFGSGVEAVVAELRLARRTADVVVPAAQPKITARAELPIYMRQVASSTKFSGTLLLAPDSVCGYISGDPARAWTCNTGDKCAFATEAGGWAACCKGLACSASQRGCVASADYSTKCDAACKSDTMTRKCTSTDYPYCGTLTFFNGIQDYQCLNNNRTTFLPVSTTYTGQETFPNGATEYLMTTVVVQAQTTFTQRSSSSIVSDPVTSPTGPASTSPVPAPAPAGNSTPIGPIVGGVVGGVALIALIAFGIWFMKSREKKKKAAAAESQGMMAQTTGAGGPGGPGAPMQSPYSTGAGGYGYPQQQTTQYTGTTHDGSQPMGGAYYQDPSKQGFQQNVAPTPDSHRQSYQQGPVPAAWAQHTGGSSGYGPQPSQPTHTGGSADQQYVQHSGPQHTGPQPTYHEASGVPVGANDPNPNHRGQLHELS
ncbi:hypothetical protein Micbo1qcDRAFT_170142 [Microdochium bolleyi]|uniref:Mid2 domain-containing protein n=1 Tax=Microdochium bolleyi TaxID=196109 RepID=A0A136JGQ3_9PEZI|nr:hypothetical protein Micbo1qcDRAFT_170142 [Microdochium bolleyi]